VLRSLKAARWRHRRVVRTEARYLADQHELMTDRGFPPPWSVEELDAMLADGAPARNNSLTEAGRLP